MPGPASASGSNAGRSAIPGRARRSDRHGPLGSVASRWSPSESRREPITTTITSVAIHTRSRFGAPIAEASGFVANPPMTYPSTPPAPINGKNRLACRVSVTMPANPQTDSATRNCAAPCSNHSACVIQPTSAASATLPTAAITASAVGIRRHARPRPTRPINAPNPTVSRNIVAPSTRYMTGSFDTPYRAKNSASMPLPPIIRPADAKNDVVTASPTDLPSPGRSPKTRAIRLTAPSTPRCSPA